MTARLTESCSISIKLASELELERGVAVVGTVWTAEDLRDYAKSRRQFIYCWSDDIHESIHYHEGEADVDNAFNEKWCNYRVCVGLRYGIETDDTGVVHYRSKIIDHMVVDVSQGEEAAIKYFKEVIDGLASRWLSDSMGKLIVTVNDKDTFSKQLFEAAGFREVCGSGDGSDWWLRMEFCKK